MTNVTVEHILYSGRRRRRGGHPTVFLLDPIRHVGVNTYPTTIHNPMIIGGQQYNVLFVSVVGAASGFSPVFTVNDTQNVDIPIDTRDVTIRIFYTTGGSGGGTTAIVDAFLLSEGRFSDERFIESATLNDVSNNPVADAANEFGEIDTSAGAVVLRSQTAVEGDLFTYWKNMATDGITNTLEHRFEPNQSGFFFAFYEDEGPIHMPEPELPRLGWLYVSPGVKVDGGGFVIGPRGPIPVGPWGGWFIRFFARLSGAFNANKTVSEKANAALKKHLNNVADSIQSKSNGIKHL